MRDFSTKCANLPQKMAVCEHLSVCLSDGAPRSVRDLQPAPESLLLPLSLLHLRSQHRSAKAKGVRAQWTSRLLSRRPGRERERRERAQREEEKERERERDRCARVQQRSFRKGAPFFLLLVFVSACVREIFRDGEGECGQVSERLEETGTLFSRNVCTPMRQFLRLRCRKRIICT